MKCPFCNCLNTKVVDTRPNDENSSIRRRRSCEVCGKKFTTYEKVENIPLIVIKKDRFRETFDKDKLMKGIMRSCHKRPVSFSQIEIIVDEIENTALNSLEKEIESEKIGELVMHKLKDIDEVAYIRFVSVYRQFKDIDTFMNELQKLIKPSTKAEGYDVSKS